MNSNEKRLVELDNRIENLTGTKIERMLEILKVAEYVNDKNYKELTETISNYKGNFSLWNLDKMRNLGISHREIIRLFHNYLSSLSSLISSARVFKKHLKNEEFSKEYDSKMKSMKINVFHRFILDIRNYSQHYGPPPISLLFFVRKSGKNKFDMRLGIVIDREFLLSWEKLTSVSKEFVKKQGDDIDMEIINDHQKEIKKNFLWLHTRINELYAKDIEELRNLELQIIEIEKILKI